MGLWNWQRFRRWIGLQEDFTDVVTLPTIPKRVETSFSTTVFAGEPEEWVKYLETPPAAAYNDVSIRIFWDDRARILEFQPQKSNSQELAELLNQGFEIVQKKAQAKPHVAAAFNRLIFQNASNRTTPFTLRISPILPSEGSREVTPGDDLIPSSTRIVLQAALVDRVMAEVHQRTSLPTEEQILGLTWPVLNRVLSELAYPDHPRDRFFERIELTTSITLLTINLLYEGQALGRIVPNRSGALVQKHVARRTGIPEADLFDQHPYFRLLNGLSFMLNERLYEGREPLAKIMIRQHLDERYLRLNIAGVMPEIPEVMLPMPYRRDRKRVSTPGPQKQRYGILDDDDYQAWKQVADPFRDMGLVLLRQLGIGQFGRVYDVLNVDNPNLPQRLALKVDRLGRDSSTILDTRATLQLSRDLAASPHVIQIYDAGVLRRNQMTYHVLQLIDGDTFDNLVGVTGREHSSITRSHKSRKSAEDVENLYLESLDASAGEAWRRRLVTPFEKPLTLHQVLDLLTSILLWVEKIHQLGYAVHDLKGGNIMISRRGQLKGIDLDTYARIESPYDQMSDFFFLAVTLWLFLRHLRGKKWRMRAKDDKTIRDSTAIREKLLGHWPFGDVEEISHGRVTNPEVLDFFVDLIHRCRSGTYVHEPELFTEDIDRLITLKRKVFVEEIVLD